MMMSNAGGPSGLGQLFAFNRRKEKAASMGSGFLIVWAM
jgi:hypothetical protein